MSVPCGKPTGGLSRTSWSQRAGQLFQGALDDAKGHYKEDVWDLGTSQTPNDDACLVFSGHRPLALSSARQCSRGFLKGGTPDLKRPGGGVRGYRGESLATSWRIRAKKEAPKMLLFSSRGVELARLPSRTAGE